VKLGQWIGLLCLLASLYILWQTKQMLLLVFTAVVIAIALNSITRQVTRHKIPRQVAIPMVITGTVLLISLFLLVIVPPFAEQFTLLIQLLIEGAQDLPERVNDLESRLPPQIQLPDSEQFFNWATSPDSAVADVFNNFFSFFNSSLRVLLQCLLVTILALMFLSSPSSYRNGFLRLFPAFYRQRADYIFAECEEALCNWLGGILISSTFVFSVSFLGLWILGIKFVFANALLAGLLNFIPNIGPTLSVIFPIMVALLSPEPWKALVVFGLYTLIQNLESYWVTPTLMARQVSLLPAFTLVAQIFFASVFGFLGLVLALPLAVVAKTWLQELIIKDILDNWPQDPNLPWFKPPNSDLAIAGAPSALPSLHPSEQQEYLKSEDLSGES
jgi:predicted PurR-regulated permease PerM